MPPANPFSPTSSARPAAGDRAFLGRGAPPAACLQQVGAGQSPVSGDPGQGAGPTGRGGAWGGRGRGRTCPAGGARGGLAAAARTDVPPPPAVCLRGDEDGGGGDGAARAPEGRQPLSVETFQSGAERRPGLAPGAAELVVPPPSEATFPSYPRPSLCLPPAFSAEAMEDEERQKKLEFGKAKVGAAGGRARGGGGGWEGWEGAWEAAIAAAPGAPARRLGEGAAGAACSPRLASRSPSPV